MSTTFEPDQDLGAAEAPHGFIVNEERDSFEPVEAPAFPPVSADPVEGLLYLGYLTDSFVLFGHRFTLKTLTRGERLAVSQVSQEWDETLGAAVAYQAAFVAASVMEVDGLPMTQLGRESDPLARVRAAFERVKGWYDPVVEELFARG